MGDREIRSERNICFSSQYGGVECLQPINPPRKWAFFRPFLSPLCPRDRHRFFAIFDLSFSPFSPPPLFFSLSFSLSPSPFSSSLRAKVDFSVRGLPSDKRPSHRRSIDRRGKIENDRSTRWIREKNDSVVCFLVFFFSFFFSRDARVFLRSYFVYFSRKRTVETIKCCICSACTRLPFISSSSDADDKYSFFRCLLIFLPLIYFNAPQQCYPDLCLSICLSIPRLLERNFATALPSSAARLFVSALLTRHGTFQPLASYIGFFRYPWDARVSYSLLPLLSGILFTRRLCQTLFKSFTHRFNFVSLLLKVGKKIINFIFLISLFNCYCCYFTLLNERCYSL